MKLFHERQESGQKKTRTGVSNSINDWKRNCLESGGASVQTAKRDACSGKGGLKEDSHSERE